MINNSVDASSERRLVSCLRRRQCVGVVDEIIQRGLVWTFTIRVWWILRFAKFFVKKRSKGQFWGFFRKYFKNIFWLFFGLFWGSKMGPPAPIRASGNWNYRATSISFGGYDRADQPVYDAIKTIKNIPDFGFNVLTIDFRCTGKIDTSAPKHYPLSRHTGSSIANKKITSEEGFVSNRRDATDLAIDEAKAENLKINLKNPQTPCDSCSL